MKQDTLLKKRRHPMIERAPPSNSYTTKIINIAFALVTQCTARFSS